jgi:rubrerythrin
MATIIEQLRRRRSEYRCKACGEWFARRKPNCPACKTRKGGRGQRLWGNSGIGMGG